jgi:4-hydroxy-2-oxoheptanedioate aldolase
MIPLPQNPFRAGLVAGRTQLGIWCMIPGPLVAEALATTGFDWVLLDTEHTVTDVPDVLPMLQAVAAYPVAPVVRAQWNDPVLIKRLLDLGAQTLMLPYVQSADAARAAVAAMRYAPAGVRGVSGMTRANRYGGVAGYQAGAAAELCLIVQIETATAVSRIPEIAAVDGVDALFIGPSDLAASMGHGADLAHPEVRAAIRSAILAIRDAGKPAGILTVDPAFARQCMDWGATVVAVGVDMTLMVTGARALRAAFAG